MLGNPGFGMGKDNHIALLFQSFRIQERKTMAFDFKKEYKEFYLPKNSPEIRMKRAAPTNGLSVCYTSLRTR